MKQPVDITLEEKCKWIMDENRMDIAHLILEEIEDILWVNTLYNIGGNVTIFSTYKEWYRKKLLEKYSIQNP